MLMGSQIQAGIKDDVEGYIRKQLGPEVTLSMKKLPLDKTLKSAIEKKVHQRFFKDYIYVWSVNVRGKVVAYGLLDNVKGMAMPITFLVLFDPEGKIMDTHVVKYREPYGGEIASPKWTEQFVGHSAESNFVVGDGIDGISGATISVYSMSTGVMKLSLLFPKIKEQL